MDSWVIGQISFWYTVVRAVRKRERATAKCKLPAGCCAFSTRLDLAPIERQRSQRASECVALTFGMISFCPLMRAFFIFAFVFAVRGTCLNRTEIVTPPPRWAKYITVWKRGQSVVGGGRACNPQISYQATGLAVLRLANRLDGQDSRPS